MSKLIDGVKHYTAKEITELCGVTSSAFNNAVYRHGLVRVMHDGHWHYPQSSVDAYRQTCKTKHTAPLQSQSAPTELPPAALQSLDPFDELPVPYVGSFVEEDPEPIEYNDEPVIDTTSPEFTEHFQGFTGVSGASEASEISPEEAMLRLVLSQLRRNVAREEAEKFAAKLKDIHSGIVACNAMILASIDNAIAEYEASQDDTSSH